MIGVRVDTNADQVMGLLAALVEDQLPYAASRALNWAAKDANTEHRRHVRKAFNVRQQWTINRLSYEASNKRQWPFLRALIGVESGAYFLKDHEEGAVRRSTRGKWAIPTGAIGRKRSGAVQDSKRPGALIRSGKARVNRKGTAILPKAKGRKRRRASRRPLYLLRDGVRIRPALELEAIVTRVATQRLPDQMQRSIQMALRDRKPRKGRR